MLGEICAVCSVRHGKIFYFGKKRSLRLGKIFFFGEKKVTVRVRDGKSRLMHFHLPEGVLVIIEQWPKSTLSS